MNTANIFDIPINLFTREQLTDSIVKKSTANKKSIVAHVNTKALNLAYEEEKFAHFFQQCALIYCDGYGPLVGAKLLGQNVRSEHRNSCPDFLDLLLSKLKAKKKAIFFLGGTEKVINRLVQILEKKHRGLNYQAHHGFFKKNGLSNDKVISKINAFNPDILYVGFGMPLQEYWIADNMLNIDANVFLPEGACLDFYTDSTYRGPKFLTDIGLEWVTRLITEPKRLWRRYLIGNPLFLIRILRSRIKRL